MRSNAPIYGILAAVWILAGTWMFSRMICGPGAVSYQIPGFSLVDGEFSANATQSFYFDENSAAPNTNDQVKEAFAKVATYLNANDNKQLALVGLYDKDEQNNTDYENLGLARAESVKKLLVMMHEAEEEKISTSSQSNDSLIYADEKLYDGVTFSFMDESQMMGHSDAGPDALDMMPEVFTFSGAKMNLQVSTDVGHYFDKLRAYLVQHPGSVVHVIGHVSDLGSQRRNEEVSLARAKKSQKSTSIK